MLYFDHARENIHEDARAPIRPLVVQRIMSITARARKLARDWLPSVLLAIVLFHALSWYQSRGMLGAEDRTPAPEFDLAGIDGERYGTENLTDRPAVLYFFAPWCTVCRASAHNLRALAKAKGSDLNVFFIALDYESKQSVTEFAERHELPAPVLLGASKTGRDYKIKGYPTYYVLDRDGVIVSRDLGYTTKLGLWWRTWRL